MLQITYHPLRVMLQITYHPLRVEPLLKPKSGICLPRGVFGHPFILDNWPQIHLGVVLLGFLHFMPWVDY